MAKNDRHLSEDEIAAYMARMERLRQAHAGYRESASSGGAANNEPPSGVGGSAASDPTNPSSPTASGSGSGGNHPPQNPPQPPPFPGGEGDALGKLLQAAEKLNQAADKLNKSADKIGKGKGEVGTTKDLGNKDESDKGLSGWAKNYLNHIGNKLGQSVEDKSVKTFGEGVGRPIGKFVRGRIGRGVKSLAKNLKKRKPSSPPEKEPDLGSASTKAREAEGAAKAGGNAEKAASAAADAGSTARVGAAAEGAAGSAAGGEAAGAGAAAGGAEAAGVELAVGADVALAETGVGAPVAITIAALAATAVALKKFHDVVKEAAEAQQQHNFKLAEASAAMAMVEAEVDIRTTFRDMEKGNRTAGSASDLSNSLQNLEDNTKEIQILFDRVVNTTLAAVVNVLDEILKPINATAQAIQWLANHIPGMPKMGDPTEGKPVSFDDQMRKIQRWEEESRRHNDEWWKHADFGRQRRDETP